MSSPSPSASSRAFDEALWFDAGGGPEAEEKAAKSMAAMAGRILGAKPLPLAARRLADLTRSPNARIEQTVRVLESDPALSARLLRLVNSAGYALRMRCASVHHAAALVGTRRLHQVATTVAVMDLFDGGGEIAERLLEHATIVGALCRYLAVHLGLPRDELFTSGFLHDIGELMLLDSDPDAFSEIFEAAGGRVDELHLHERQRFGFDHAVLAANVLTAWNIPDPIPRVVALHHTPSRAYEAGGVVGAMVAALRLADQLSHALVEEDVVAAVEQVARGDAASYLDVSEGQLAAMWKELQGLREQCSARSGGIDVAEVDIVPRHEIRHSQRAPSSRVAQAPMHFPCIVCQKPSFGNVCPCCEGYVCPTHQAGRDEWCTTCTRAYRSSLEESALRPIDKAALGLGGVALAASAAAGAAATAPDALANLVVGPGLALLLAGTVFTVGRSSYLRARFVTRRRKAGLSAPSAPEDQPASRLPAAEASADTEIMAPEATLASPFEKSLDAMLTRGAGESPLAAKAWPGPAELMSTPMVSEHEDLGHAATTIAPSSSPSGGRDLSPATMEAALPRIAGPELGPSVSPPPAGSGYPAIEYRQLQSVQRTETDFLPLEGLRRDQAERAPTVMASSETELGAARALVTLPVTSGRTGNGVALVPLEALPMVRLEASPEASTPESASFLMPSANVPVIAAAVAPPDVTERAPASGPSEIVERAPVNTAPAFAAVSCQIQPTWYPCVATRTRHPEPDADQPSAATDSAESVDGRAVPATATAEEAHAVGEAEARAEEARIATQAAADALAAEARAAELLAAQAHAVEALAAQARAAEALAAEALAAEARAAEALAAEARAAEALAAEARAAEALAAEARAEALAAEGLAAQMRAAEAAAEAGPRAADSLPSIPFAEALLSLPSIVVTVAPPAGEPTPAARAVQTTAASVSPTGGRGERAYGGALSIPPNAFDDEPDRSRRGKGRTGAAGVQAARRARYG